MESHDEQKSPLTKLNNDSTAWTWGKQKGNQGWAVEDMEDEDAWQGVTPVDSWNLRLGAIHVQCPQVITDASTGICRLAWLPDDKTLLRIEAGVTVSILFCRFLLTCRTLKGICYLSLGAAATD